MGRIPISRSSVPWSWAEDSERAFGSFVLGRILLFGSGHSVKLIRLIPAFRPNIYTSAIDVLSGQFDDELRKLFVFIRFSEERADVVENDLHFRS